MIRNTVTGVETVEGLLRNFFIYSMMMRSGIIDDKLSNMTKIEFIFFYFVSLKQFSKFMILFQLLLFLSLSLRRKKTKKTFWNFWEQFLLRNFFFCGTLDWLSWRCHPARFHKWRNVTRHHNTWGQLSEINLQVRSTRFRIISAVDWFRSWEILSRRTWNNYYF